MLVNTPVVLQLTWTLRLSKRQKVGAVRLTLPVIAAEKPVQVLLDICTLAFTEGTGGPLVKQRGAVVSPQDIALMQ